MESMETIPPHYHNHISASTHSDGRVDSSLGSNMGHILLPQQQQHHTYQPQNPNTWNISSNNKNDKKNELSQDHRIQNKISHNPIRRHPSRHRRKTLCQYTTTYSTSTTNTRLHNLSENIPNSVDNPNPKTSNGWIRTFNRCSCLDPGNRHNSSG